MVQGRLGICKFKCLRSERLFSLWKLVYYYFCNIMWKIFCQKNSKLNQPLGWVNWTGLIASCFDIARFVQTLSFTWLLRNTEYGWNKVGMDTKWVKWWEKMKIRFENVAELKQLIKIAKDCCTKATFYLQEK